VARIVFFGTPALSVPTLDALCDHGHEVVLVVSQADKRRGRRGELSPSPVKERALERGLATTARVRDVLDVQADFGVLVAFGRLIKPEILDYLNILNLHPSLLPRWRGATPVEAAILAGDTETGICVMKLANEMDAGDVYARFVTDISPKESSFELYQRLFRVGNEMLIDLLKQPLPPPAPQTGNATYCGKLSAEDFRVELDQPADHIVRLTRIGRPWTIRDGKRLLIIDADIASDGSLHLITVQPEGKKPMSADDWRRGLRNSK
jgi:methionyl-tRNA formyltransferase